jgi:AcrR family transcriptional regulator
MTDEVRPPTTRQRSTRKDQTAETRRRLLSAARSEIVEHGLAEARIDRIVDSVGLTRGAFYGHFDSLVEVSIELLEIEQEREQPEFEQFVEDVSDQHTLLEALAARRSRRDGGYPLSNRFIAELLLAAARDADLRQRMADLYRARRHAMASVIESLAAAIGVELTDTPDRLAHIVMALEIGLAVPTSILGDDDDVPRFVDEIMPTFFLGGAIKPTTERRPGRES